MAEAQPGAKSGKKRIHIRVVDVDSGEEISSTEVVTASTILRACSCSSCCWPTIDGPVAE
jgi:hypothetical protein